MGRTVRGFVFFLALLGPLAWGVTAAAADSKEKSSGSKPAWVPGTSAAEQLLDRLIAERGYSIGSAFVDSFMNPALCGGADSESSTDFLQHLLRTFLRRSPTDQELAALLGLLARGYPRRALVEAVVDRLPETPLDSKSTLLTAALRWEAKSVLFDEMLNWSGVRLEETFNNSGLLMPLLALYEGADARRSLLDLLLIRSMHTIPPEAARVFLLYSVTAVLGRTPTAAEVERFQKLLLPIDPSRESRTPIFTRFDFLEMLFATDAGIPRRFLGTVLERCNPSLNGPLSSPLPDWILSRDGLLARIDALEHLPPLEPPPSACNGYNPNLRLIGHIGSDAFNFGENCADNYAFIALDRGDRGNLRTMSAKTPLQTGATGYCCRLPAADILLSQHRYEAERCPVGYVATGGRSRANLDYCPTPEHPNCTSLQRSREALMRCTKINGARYQLSAARSGRLWLQTPSGTRETTAPLLLQDIPAAVRQTVGFKQVRNRLDHGCIGTPIGSLLVEKGGQRCEKLYFRELQYRGLPGDPPRGTAVKMFPDCDDVDSSKPERPICVQH